MSLFAIIAEQRIKEAIAEGQFDNLALHGQPLPREDDSAVPEELRMGYKILKNGGYLPEELLLRQEIVSLQDLLQACHDPEERSRTKRKLSLRQLQLDHLLERNGRNLAYSDYSPQLQHRLAG